MKQFFKKMEEYFCILYKIFDFQLKVQTLLLIQEWYEVELDEFSVNCIATFKILLWQNKPPCIEMLKQCHFFFFKPTLKIMLYKTLMNEWIISLR